MNLDELFKIAQQFPMANIQEDMEGEIIIYTGLMYDAPLGYNGYGPQNIPAKHRQHVELREMTHEDVE
jgi:hypothetical protein